MGTHPSELVDTSAGLVAAKPFVKWAGGKSRVLPAIVSRIPREFGRLFEPFAGGAALYFHLAREGGYLSDTNAELVNTYEIVRDRVEDLLEILVNYPYEESFYYRVRDMDREPAYATRSALERAARFIYLNKTCYNGLFRVNSKGQFNVPFGDYKSPRIAEPENLRACSRLLQSAEIAVASFEAVEARAERGDFVYFDPPYAPLSPTSNFTAYTREGFGEEEQVRLRDLCERLSRNGVHWMVSNSAAPLILDLYREFEVSRIPVARAINSKSNGRGKIDEVIVTSYRQ